MGGAGPIDVVLVAESAVDFAGTARGPYSSSESLSSSISSWFACRGALFGGELASASSSGVRLRFVRCGGSCGPIEDMTVA